MATETLSVRTKMKRDTTARWNARPDFIPLLGEIIVYTDFAQVAGKNIPNIKIGDGLAYCVDLPFLYSADDSELQAHVEDTIRHVTAEERALWNNKINIELDGENLILNRN